MLEVDDLEQLPHQRRAFTLRNVGQYETHGLILPTARPFLPQVIEKLRAAGFKTSQSATGSEGRQPGSKPAKAPTGSEGKRAGFKTSQSADRPGRAEGRRSMNQRQELCCIRPTALAYGSARVKTRATSA